MLSQAKANVLATLIIKKVRPYSDVHEEDRPRVNIALIAKGRADLIPGYVPTQPPDEPDEPDEP